jgi:hypothetical protein
MFWHPVPIRALELHPHDSPSPHLTGMWMSTPLATIAVVAKELEHYASQSLRNNPITEDSRLIRQELERRHAILQRMSLAGAEPVGEAGRRPAR